MFSAVIIFGSVAIFSKISGIWIHSAKTYSAFDTYTSTLIRQVHRELCMQLLRLFLFEHSQCRLDLFKGRLSLYSREYFPLLVTLYVALRFVASNTSKHGSANTTRIFCSEIRSACEISSLRLAGELTAPPTKFFYQLEIETPCFGDEPIPIEVQKGIQLS